MAVLLLLLLLLLSAIAWKALYSALDDAGDGIFGLRVNVGRIRPLREERLLLEELRRRLDLRLTTKHGGVAVVVVRVVVGGGIAWKATGT
eukprot:CAMPEP_0168279178 /NCGR_PEP_ID=MMETSP0141_2-20121125/20333_1 /TAXON_ID=44445 /ORGANISM="Pseudo-nitzschia australis, Strain 10249 10 AB" /LENGTH=89 /DNA_ID=CAMNT_0008222095 /DNA_START=312 /DNA_END=582 /DNA_ORIENTATION=+